MALLRLAEQHGGTEGVRAFLRTERAAALTDNDTWRMFADLPVVADFLAVGTFRQVLAAWSAGRERARTGVAARGGGALLRVVEGARRGAIAEVAMQLLGEGR